MLTIFLFLALYFSLILLLLRYLQFWRLFLCVILSIALNVILFIKWTWFNILLILHVDFVIWGVLFPKRLLSILKRHPRIIRPPRKCPFLTEIFTDRIEHPLIVDIYIFPQHISQTIPELTINRLSKQQLVLILYIDGVDHLCI